MIFENTPLVEVARLTSSRKCVEAGGCVLLLCLL